MDLVEFVESGKAKGLSLQSWKILHCEAMVRFASSMLRRALRGRVFASEPRAAALCDCLAALESSQDSAEHMLAASQELADAIALAKKRGCWIGYDDLDLSSPKASVRKINHGLWGACAALERLQAAVENLGKSSLLSVDSDLPVAMLFVGQVAGVSDQIAKPPTENHAKKEIHAAWCKVRPDNLGRGFTEAFCNDQKVSHPDVPIGSIKQWVKLWNSHGDEALNWKDAKDIRDAKPK